MPRKFVRPSVVRAIAMRNPEAAARLTRLFARAAEAGYSLDSARLEVEARIASAQL